MTRNDEPKTKRFRPFELGNENGKCPGVLINNETDGTYEIHREQKRQSGGRPLEKEI